MQSPEIPPYLDHLNEAQRQSVMAIEGPVMIIAGAGSGKTRVLTYRIAHIMKQGVDSFNILALTFTNKAAKEMRERIENLVGADAKNLWMGTFHSVFAKILRVEADKLGYPQNFTIYDTDDSKSLIKSIVKEMNLDEKMYKPGLVLGRISNAKNNLVTADLYSSSFEITSKDTNTGRPKMAEIFMEYQKRCFKAGAMDFDDLLLNTDKLLREFPEVLYKYQHKFKYILVDEYQDTNYCQYMIIKKLAAMHQNICVVGDDAQSIYSFRGATIKNILNFERDYPNLQVFKLEQNYRSTKTIVEAASSVIKNNRDQLKKEVWTDNTSGDKIKVIRALSDNEEGKLVAQQIFEEKMRNQQPNKAFAILYRTNAQSRSFEESLRKLNILYRVYGGLSFYQRKEVKDMIAYLRLIVNPADEEAFKRIINYPARKIGGTTIDKIIYFAGEQGCSLWDISCNTASFKEFGASSIHIDNFVMMIRSFQAMQDSHNAYDLANHVAKQTTLLKTLYEDKTVEGISRYENIVELLNAIKEFTEDDTSEVEKTLSNFLQEVALYTDADKENENNLDRVTLMTVHGAKGLEFPYVFVTGMEENLFPSQMALNSREDLEEERRLFYVAITRAEKKLMLSFATSRFKFGNLIHSDASRFLDEIDAGHLEFANTPAPKTEPSKPTGIYGRETSFAMRDKKTGKQTFSSPVFAANPNFVAEPVFDLAVGQKIEHQRFGKGEVTHIDGMGDSKKAIINFDLAGEKTLVLKFAKMRKI